MKNEATPLRIGYLLRMYPRFSQTFVVNEIREVENQGVDVRIASLRLPNEGMFHESITKVRAQASYLEERFLGCTRPQLAAQWRLMRKDFRSYRGVVRLARRHPGVEWFELCQAASLLRWAQKQEVRHVHVHFGTDEANVAMFSHMLGGPSYSLTLHAFDIFRDNVDRALLVKKINASRFIVTVCESNAAFLRGLPGVDPGKIHVIYNGIDMSTFSTGSGDREPYSIFSVGRLIEKKGFIQLVRAVAILRDAGLPVICRIAGEGRDESKIRKLIHELHLDKEVQLLGSVRQDEVRALMQRSSCFALACIQAKDGNIDALPTVLLESLACGCPSVSTRLSGVPEIIEDGQSGLLVEPEDVRGLADAIQRVLVEPQTWQKLSVGGRARAEDRFDVRKSVACMRERFAGVLSGGIKASDGGKTAPCKDSQSSPALVSTQEAA